MRTYYEGPTYTVEFDEADTECFTRHTDSPQGVVRGRGAFIFDTLTGDLVRARGAARGKKEMEWLAFSQDAQEHARDELQRYGVVVNPYEFACELPEVANPKKAAKKVGQVLVMGNPCGCPHVTPGQQGIVRNVDDDGVIYVEWENGTSSAVGKKDNVSKLPINNPARISRTRGVKTMRGPYSARRGYKPWIQRRGKLGEGFLTTMTKKEREKALDRCVDAYGYRSCLGSIMVLERSKTGPGGKGKGVGVKYASKLKSSREYLKEKYGGKGSFGPRKEKRERVARAADVGPGYSANPSHLSEISLTEISKKLDLDPDQERLLDQLVLAAKMDGAAYRARDAKAAVERAFQNLRTFARQQLDADYQVVRSEAARLVKKRWKPSNPKKNPSASEHERRAFAYLKEGEQVMRRAMSHYESAMKGSDRGVRVEADEACAYARDAHRYAILAEHEIDDAASGRSRKQFRETVAQLKASAAAMLDKFGCSWEA